MLICVYVVSVCVVQTTRIHNEQVMHDKALPVAASCLHDLCSLEEAGGQFLNHAWIHAKEGHCSPNTLLPFSLHMLLHIGVLV